MQRSRRWFRSVSDALLVGSVVGLCSLALSREGRADWIRRPQLTEGLADTPRLFQCMKGLADKSGVKSARLRFSGPFLTSDRAQAWYLVYEGPGEAPYRLEFSASENHRWRLFSYGADFNTRIGAFTGRMETRATLRERGQGAVVDHWELLPCAKFLGQGIGHGR